MSDLLWPLSYPAMVDESLMAKDESLSGGPFLQSFARSGTGGEIRTPNICGLSAVCLPVAPLRREGDT
jgi:hypothetical protein